MTAYNGEYENILRPFVDAMRYKLHANKHKGVDWEKYTFKELFERLNGEIKELQEAIERGNTVEIMLEAADVANYACIVSYLAVRAAGSGKGSIFAEKISVLQRYTESWDQGITISSGGGTAVSVGAGLALNAVGTDIAGMVMVTATEAPEAERLVPRWTGNLTPRGDG